MAIEATSSINVSSVLLDLGKTLATTGIAVAGAAATDAIRAKLGVGAPTSPIVPANTAPVPSSPAASPSPQAPVASPGTGPGTNAGSNAAAPVPAPGDGPTILGWSAKSLALAAVLIVGAAAAFKFLAK